MNKDYDSDEISLDSIKCDIEESYDYFKKNYDRFNDFYRFVCVSTLSQSELDKLKALGKPPLTFNITEAFVSRQRAEFMAQEPSITMRVAPGLNPTQLKPDFYSMMDLLEAHMRESLNNPKNDQTAYQIYTDLLIGGFSTAEVFPEYCSDKTLKQEITIKRAYNPCMVGFDPLAQESHKGDGEYCFKVYPMLLKEFKRQFKSQLGPEGVNGMVFSSNLENFNWAYENGSKRLVLVADYYRKRYKDSMIYELADGQTLTKEEYTEFIEKWLMSGNPAVPPAIVDQRKTRLVSIDRWVICQNKLLEHTQTDFRLLPLVFMDGNSVKIQTSASAAYEQWTRSYVYNVKSTQKLKDFAGQTMAAEIENLMMSKLLAPLEGIPSDEDYKDGYRNFQQASVIVYNGFKTDDPTIPVAPPREIQRTQTPQVVLDAFHGADALMQMILGSYDLQPGIQNDVSGESIKQGALQATQGAQPYLMGYIRGLNRIAEILLDLIPKYYKTTRTIPIMTQDGKRDYVVINNPDDPQSIMMDYDPYSLEVVVEAGPNIGTQRQMALEQLTSAAKILPSFGKFLDQEGGEIIIDNMDLKGGERLKAMYGSFMQQEKGTQQEQTQIQQQMVQLEMQTKQADIQGITMKAQTEQKKVDNQESQFVADYLLSEQQHMRDFKAKAAEIAIKNKEADADMLKAKVALDNEQVNQLLEAEKIDAEKARSTVDLAIELSKHYHQKEVDMRSLDIEQTKAEKPTPTPKVTK